MINSEAKLSDKLFHDDIPQAPTRNGYGEGLVAAGKENPNVVVLCADLTESTRSLAFKEVFPERFIEAGISEQNMADVAAGLAKYGKIPFISSYATFSPGRNWEQIRTTVAYNNVPVKVGGAHAGISVGPDGGTHQALEDLAIMRALPNMTVIAPADSIETRKATLAASRTNTPVYLRFAREATPVFTTDGSPFEIGKAVVLREGKDVALIGAGPLLYNALLAAEQLAQKGIDAAVVDSHTVKPLDEETILRVAGATKRVVSVEEHQVIGGLGSALAELFAKKMPIPMEFIGVQDRFGESGEPQELLEAFGMGVGSIVQAIERVMQR